MAKIRVNPRKLFDSAKKKFVTFKKRLPAKKVTVFVDKKPFTSFFIALGVLLLLIVVGNFISNLSKKEAKEQVLVKEVKIYSIGTSPKVSLQGQVEKSGVYKIIAQTSGIVQRVNYKEGDRVSKGQSLVSLSTNYQGGNIPGLQASLAQKQYKNILDTYDTQKSIIEDQKNIASYSAQSADRLRDISRQGLDETNSLIDLNNDILDTLNNQLSTLQSTNVGGSNDAQILQTQQLIAQLRSGLAQLNASSRSLALQAGGDNPPARIADIQKNMSIKQLDIQLKALDLNREMSRIQAAIAGISASFMNPTSPAVGTIERIYVKVGESVNPGTVLALISGDTKGQAVVVRVPYEIASRISMTEESTIHFSGKTVKAVPTYVSGEATDGQLYSVIYSVDPEDGVSTDDSYITIDIPVGYPDTLSSIPFIPLDAVYQTQDEGYVLIVKNGKAEEKKVTLGSVYGRFVQIISGLSKNDQVILNRNVIAGDNVKEI